MNTRPKKKADHEENRKKVCAICFKKIILVKSNSSKRLINQLQEELIRKYVNNQFDLNDSKYSKATCTDCPISLNLLKDNKGNFYQNIPNFTDIVLEKQKN